MIAHARSNVPTRKLADCGQWFTGGTPSRSNPDYWNGDIPWISAKSLKAFRVGSSDEQVTTKGAENGSRVVKAGTVLFVVRGMSLANEFRVGVSERAVAFNQDLRAIVPRTDIDAGYLAHYLRFAQGTVLGLVDRASHGTTRLNSDRLGALDVPTPSHSEQRRIARILDKADDLRAQRSAALAELDGLAQSVFVAMFGDPRTNPKGWPVGTVEAVADVQGGLQLSGARKGNPQEVPYLRVANVYRNFLDLREIKRLRATPSEIARTTLVRGDVLLVEGHGNPDEIGRAATWDGSIERCVHQNHLIRARFDLSRLLPDYACYFLNSPGGRNHLLRSGRTTSGLNTISVSDVKAAPIALPPVDLQRRFSLRLQAIRRHVERYLASRAILDALFASLQHRAFSGEL